MASGGVLIVDMGDNDWDGGFIAPGAVGTPTLVFPDDGADATLAATAAGADGLLGTTDDHRLVRGPDGMAGTADDLTNTNIDACCYVAHGNLQDGIVLPPSAKTLMTARFATVAKPIVAEYCAGSGRVILDTVTKEFEGHQPEGSGPSYFLSALLGYALDPSEHVSCQINGLAESVRGIAANQPFAGELDAKLRGASAAIDSGRRSAACGKLQAFLNSVKAHVRELTPVLAPMIGSRAPVEFGRHSAVEASAARSSGPRRHFMFQNAHQQTRAPRTNVHGRLAITDLRSGLRGTGDMHETQVPIPPETHPALRRGPKACRGTHRMWKPPHTAHFAERPQGRTLDGHTRLERGDPIEPGHRLTVEADVVAEQ